MNTEKTPLGLNGIRISPEIVDLLPSTPSQVSFAVRVQALSLSSDLEKKILQQDMGLTRDIDRRQKTAILTEIDEKELAGEVLRHRHLFTERLLTAPRFRQAVLTVIQNIFLFRNRKIFFGSTWTSPESERQEALFLFSTSQPQISIPLAKTFQHLILARVWRRIISQSTDRDFVDHRFSALLEVVEKLNTLRNIYVLLTTGLVKKLASQTNPLYKQSITYEDAVQIGTIGIARAAYRYHPSSGVRFSTFAAHWVSSEIQRQALDGRLIRISPNTVEGYAKATKNEDLVNLKRYSTLIESATTVEHNSGDENSAFALSEVPSQPSSPVSTFEKSQLRLIMMQTIDRILSQKTGDIIKRRFGLPPYQGKEQSILSISEEYRVTRSSIYQQEQTALKKLRLHLRGQCLCL